VSVDQPGGDDQAAHIHAFFGLPAREHVFAGADIDATERARGYFTGYPPSSPSIGLLRDGKLVWMLERRQIENQGPEQIAAALTSAFEKFCGSAVQAQP